MNWLCILVMVLGLFMIPVGLPGLWLMCAAVLYGYFTHQVSLFTTAVCIAIALVAELIEFLVIKRVTQRYGGSRKAFWGAVAGGLVGVVVGVPIPVIGSVIAALVGSFVGAALVTFFETRELIAAHRVGWGAVVGRMLAAVTKTAAGFAVLVLGTAALLT